MCKLNSVTKSQQAIRELVKADSLTRGSVCYRNGPCANTKTKAHMTSKAAPPITHKAVYCLRKLPIRAKSLISDGACIRFSLPNVTFYNALQVALAACSTP